jgi:hypothetical protein
VVHTKTTSFVEAASSLRRVLYACDCDATLKTEKLLSLSKGAASCGSSDVLALAKAIEGRNWLAWHQQLCMAAAAGNQLATLQELRIDVGPKQQWEVVKVATKAAECADLSMLQWVVEQHPQAEWTAESTQQVIKGAAGALDFIDKVHWLCQWFPDGSLALRFYFALAAIRCDAVALLQWLVSSGYQFNDGYYANVASAAGQLAVLRYLVEEAGCAWDAATVRTAAAKAGSVEVLQWASNADDAVWTTALLSELLIVAGVNDQLRAADWLRAAGAEWPTSFLYQGPVFPGLGVWSVRAMQWAWANGCPWGV